ncbi:MAG: C10 family peptidase, partial [Bacteroidales bacterium]|nr:C10 family peptidase [Bacteroidales bacterium]
MKNKLIWVGLASLLFLMGAKAAPVSLETAKKTAEKFYGVQLQKATVKSLPVLSCVYPKSTKGADFVPYYIFNAEKEQGFVIVAGDDNAASLILGYSDKGSFQTENMPDNLKFWLGFYEEGVRSAAAHGGSGNMQAKSGFTKAEVVKEPLLDSISYNQAAPYNDLCPIDHTTGKRSMTGCVATALTTIARYYEYPKHGQDSITYTTSKGLELSMDFSKNTYDWENMLKSYNGKLSQYTEEQRTAVATLMRDMGYAVQMGYGSDASGALRDPTVIGMVKYMGFDSILNFRERMDYDNDDQWIAVLKDNLDNDLPVYYTGQGDGGGHAFVCDGYNDNDFFHIDWGWAGLNNGYFSVRNLDPGNIEGIGAGTGGGYSKMQAIMHNMVPPGHKHCEDLFMIKT